jgi:hypothetical protein
MTFNGQTDREMGENISLETIFVSCLTISNEHVGV